MHKTVLLQESIQVLDISPSDVVVDATLGGSGHAEAIVREMGKDGVFIGFDLDIDAIERARQRLSGAKCRVELINDNFRNIKQAIGNIGIDKIDKILFDLGWSQFQLSDGRGFSFLADEPLRMNYSKGSNLVTAGLIVNTWAEQSIADIIYGWGEERYSRRIARAIVDYRSRKQIETSRELGEIICQCVPSAYRHGRIHPATKSFQALRIAVNDELGAVSQGMRDAWDILAVDGRLAIISFHSIEDRIVKRIMRQWIDMNQATPVLKKPLIATQEELSLNPRARSAKLRCVQKINDSQSSLIETNN